MSDFSGVASVERAGAAITATCAAEDEDEDEDEAHAGATLSGRIAAQDASG